MSAFLRRRPVFAGAMLALSLASSSARADIIRVSDMLRGIEIPQSQCSSIGQAVWVNVHSYSFCIRYFLSTAGGGTGKPIVFLQGDQLGRLDGRTNNFNPPPATRDTDTSKLLNFADGLSKAAKSPAIYDARRRRLRYGHITGLEKRIANMLACHGIASCAGLRA